MAGYLEDLDELILKCRNKNAREYIREAVASYRAEAYRSSIVSCWVAVCYDLIEKFRELALAGDKQATLKIESLDAIQRENNTAGSLKFEREVLDFARDKLELISALEYVDLDRILKDRHRCAHPSLTAEGEQYAPPAELARLHIHSAVIHLLQHEPAQGKFALARVLSQINSRYFPSKQGEVLNFLKNSPVRRARPSLVRSLTTVLLKDLFLDDEIEYTTGLKLTAALNSLSSMHHIVYEDRCIEILSDILSQVDDENLHNAALRLVRLHGGWNLLNEHEQGRVFRFVAEIPTQHFDILGALLTYPPLQDVAKRRVKCASFEDLNEVFDLFVPREVIDRAIELYHSAESFDEANKLAKLIQGFTSDFSVEQISVLLSKIDCNSQITGSFELPHLLARLRKSTSNKQIDFDSLLREHGLEQYCEDAIER